MKRLSFICASFSLLQVLLAASLEDKYEPMVAFICERPAMHRGVNGWIPDKSTDCLDRMEDILTYCKSMYPDHNITNVVEASYLVTISDWPMGKSDRQHSHRVRPFRCLVGGFQSDALLVPQHCEFDHRHDQSQCEGFSHWNSVADEACAKKGMHLESFGMLLNCQLGKFSGVEYVCCPVKTQGANCTPNTPESTEPFSFIMIHELIVGNRFRYLLYCAVWAKLAANDLRTMVTV
nr:amyloid beta A4 protein-like [Biomphalaria glabrata]